MEITTHVSTNPVSDARRAEILSDPGFGNYFTDHMFRVEKSAELEDAVGEALAYPGAALVDVVVNPDEPPMPPKVTYEQAKGFAQAFLKGQPHRATIASTLFRDKIAQLRS